ncbi:uncharacterized protein I303_103180 [Kwoniella dejecticola CBS 10117]|uniref:Uncharacterized protein n=1 Tax=Kwoniella dejecticola CBS 10117 TaxID=1296121 RepID=A0A1A6AAV8_9TREE|nr:uncharacterized protein I303_03202 [Kwoniella dejecticola CBS 10117]OBR87178.1 hypothetical protein I303_03202 [Kwoniella dejecticola CBS 10117]
MSNERECSTCDNIITTQTCSPFFNALAYCNHCGTDKLRDSRYTLSQEDEYQEAKSDPEDAQQEYNRIANALDRASRELDAAQEKYNEASYALRQVQEQLRTSKKDCCQANEDDTDESDWEAENGTEHDNSNYLQAVAEGEEDEEDEENEEGEEDQA